MNPLVRGELYVTKEVLLDYSTYTLSILLRLKQKIYGQWPESRKKFECRETHLVKNIYEEFLKSPDELRKEKGQPFIKWTSSCYPHTKLTKERSKKKFLNKKVISNFSAKAVLK